MKMKMKVFGFVTILLVICKYIECDNVAQQQPLFCNDLRPQNQVDIEQVRIYSSKCFSFNFEKNCIFFSF